MKSFLKNYKISIPLGLAIAGFLAWLAFGYFAVQTLFTDDKVSEAAPVFDSSASTVPASATTIASVPPDSTPLPTITVPGTSATTSTTAPVPEITIDAVGAFRSREHTTTGTASVLGNGTGQRFLRFESFSTSNGPDLNVYLVNSSAGGVSDFVDLGNLKGNIGDQNYEIPEGVDLQVYDTVLIWCVRFSSPFGDATLAAP